MGGVGGAFRLRDGGKRVKNAPRRGGVAAGGGASRGGRGSRRGSRDGARAGTRDGEVSFASVGISDDANATRDPLLDPALDPPREMAGRARSGGGLKKEKTPRETRKRVRWSEGVEANDFFTKKKKKTRRASAFRRAKCRARRRRLFRARGGYGRRGRFEGFRTSRAVRASLLVRRRRRRAETDKIDDETWASLPPEVRDEISRFQPGTRATPLGGAGPRKPAGYTTPPPASRPEASRSMPSARTWACAPRASSQARRSVPRGRRGRRGRLRRPGAARGEKEGRRHRRRRRRLARVLLADRPRGPRGDRRGGGTHALRAHYERAAREKIMRARRAGGARAPKGGKNAAAAGQKNAACVFRQDATGSAAANARRRRG